MVHLGAVVKHFSLIHVIDGRSVFSEESSSSLTLTSVSHGHNNCGRIFIYLKALD